MTRRERMLRILENLGDQRTRYALDRLVTPRKLSLLSDDGIEDLTVSVVRDWRRSQRMNRANRAIYAAGQAQITTQQEQRP